MSMFQGRGPVRFANEIESPLNLFSRRLATLGVSADDLDEVRAQWESATPEERATLAAMTDDQLRADLADVEAEWTYHHEPAAVSAPTDGAARDILNWVGDDPVRASIALEAEQSRPKPRSSLIAKLRAVR